MKKWVRAAIAVARVFFKVFYPVKMEGLENIPESGAFMLCINHTSAFDPIELYFNLTRGIQFMAKSELFGNKLVAAVLSAVGAFPVERGKADLGAVRKSIEILKNGGGFGIFPQGTRSYENAQTEMHTGAAMIRQRTLSPIIPVYIDAPYHMFKKTRITIGSEIDLSEFGKKSDSVTIAQITEKISDSIWALKRC